jgi:hypothetical protein
MQPTTHVHSAAFYSSLPHFEAGFVLSVARGFNHRYKTGINDPGYRVEFLWMAPRATSQS